MKLLAILFFCAVPVASIASAILERQNHTQRLQDWIFKKNKYNSFIAPVNDDLSLVEVHVKFIVFPYSLFNIREETVSFSGFVLTSWVDTRLKWDPESYGNLTHIHLPQSKIWRPDVVIFDVSMTLYKEVFGNVHNMLEVSHTGKVEWQYIYASYFLCTVSLSKYPFDTNICSVSVTSWVSDNSYKMISNTSYVEIPFTHEHGELELELSDTICNHYNYTLKTTEYCEVRIKLTRRPLSILLNMFIPITLLSLLCTVSFLLAPENPDKMNLTINSLLSVIVFLSLVSHTLPNKANEVSALSVYILLLVCHGFLANVGTVVVLILVDHCSNNKISDEQRPDDRSTQEDYISILDQKSSRPGDEMRNERVTPKIDISNKKDNQSTIAVKVNRCFFILSLTFIILNGARFWIQSFS